MEWEPIETAPKDGTEIIGMGVDGFIAILHYCTRQNAFVNRFDGQDWTGHVYVWIPLPGNTPYVFPSDTVPSDM